MAKYLVIILTKKKKCGTHYEIGAFCNRTINARREHRCLGKLPAPTTCVTTIFVIFVQVMERAVFHAENCYLIPNIRVLGYMCMTNLPSNTAFRGFGGPQV